MTKATSAKITFLVSLLVVLTAIIIPVMLANDNRNLNRLLVHFGLEPIIVERTPVTLKPYQLKTKRLPRPRVVVAARLLATTPYGNARFVRDIAKDPQALCQALAVAGFVASQWTVSRFDASSWECTSYREFPTDRSERRPPSSAFIVVKGSKQASVSSFRIKLNIENQNTSRLVTEAVEKAIETFLEAVRWADAPDIRDNIRALREFDFIRFGNRIQLKKEHSTTPRYNLLITPDHQGNKRPFLPNYFDRERWLAYLDKKRTYPTGGSWLWEEASVSDWGGDKP